jgi:hypothetical protein
MAKFFLFISLFINLCAIGQSDSTGLVHLGRETTLSELVIRSDLDVSAFLKRVRDDTTFYKAFRNIRILGFSSINDIQMLDKKGRIAASLHSRTQQQVQNGCRSMKLLQEEITGDMYKGGSFNYYTALLYASLFFTNGTVCNETNIVAGIERRVANKTGLDKHKEQLKMLFFNPGKKIPGIPFIGDKIDIFNPDIAQYYSFAVDMEARNNEQCYVFTIQPREGLSRSEKNKIVFDKIVTWFNAKTLEIVSRTYDLSYNTPVYDFNVHMEVELQKFGSLLVPVTLRYNGNWKVAFKKRERGLFTATLYDFH